MSNKFADWIKNNEKKHRGVAEKLSISTSTLHDILKKGQMPSLRVAYEIEKYTKGDITIYDWVDQAVVPNKKKVVKKTVSDPKSKKISK